MREKIEFYFKEGDDNFSIHEFCREIGNNLGEFSKFTRGDARLVVFNMPMKYANLIKKNKKFFGFTRGMSCKVKERTILMIKRKVV